MMGLFLCSDEDRERKSRKCDDGDSDGDDDVVVVVEERKISDRRWNYRQREGAWLSYVGVDSLVPFRNITKKDTNKCQNFIKKPKICFFFNMERSSGYLQLQASRFGAVIEQASMHAQLTQFLLHLFFLFRCDYLYLEIPGILNWSMLQKLWVEERWMLSLEVLFRLLTVGELIETDRYSAELPSPGNVEESDDIPLRIPPWSVFCIYLHGSPSGLSASSRIKYPRLW